MAFELALVAMVALLPRDSWFFVKVFNFLQYSHSPFLWSLSRTGPESMVGGILVLVLIALSMAGIWACLLLGAKALLAYGLARLGLSKRQNRFLGWSAGFLAMAGLLWCVVDVSADKPVPFTSTPEIKAVVAGNTALALDLYHKVKGTPGNIFFSPYSISTGLGLVYAGAQGATKRELARVAHFSLTQAGLHPAFGELMARVNRVEHGRRLTLQTANALWWQAGYSCSNSFLDLARRHYGAQVKAVDFSHTPEAAAETVNAWVEKRTHGKIKGMLNPGSLDSDTRLLLCNAVYFKGNWRSQFKVQATCPAPFAISEEKSVSVPMMAQEAEFKTARLEDPRATLLEMPYFGGDLAMVIILPEAVDGLVELENELTAENLHSWLALLDKSSAYKTWVRLPRFSTRRELNLVPVLRDLGMVSAFGAAADFSCMDGTKNLFLSQALHQAYVEVNEAGTEAAVATLFEAKSKSMAGRFNADHPFLYLIRDHGSGTILFLGRLVDPTR
ncbi:MAG TPA: serpin family protein [Bacillota bacterium]|nr:serpin family protein [Bacillota bacterium]